VIEQAGRPLLYVLLDPGLGLGIPRSRPRGGLVKVLEQVVNGPLILLVHTKQRTPKARADTVAVLEAAIAASMR
jgi:hypothetical protein